MGTSTVIQTSWSALKRKDLRRHRRYAVDAGILQVSWLDITGTMKMTRTRALNISEGGIALELPEAAMPLSMVRFQSDRFKVRGAGAVRHCHRVGAKYVVGLEFVEGLHWRAPEDEVREPISLCDPESE
jgi:PilZ domain